MDKVGFTVVPLALFQLSTSCRSFGQRTWTTFNYIAYWVSDAWNAAVWQLASSMLAIGLSW